MTNLLNLPQIPAGTTISIVSNSDWLDQFYVQQPGFPAAPVQITATMDGATGVLTAPSSVAGIVPGSQVVGYGVPGGTFVSSVTSTTITLNTPTTAAATQVPLSFFGPPLDLSGITFTSIVRQTPQSATILLKASTTNGLMLNGGVSGNFGWNVPAAKLPNWPGLITGVGTISCFTDIQATDATGQLVNLCVNGGIPLTVVLPETR